MPELSYDEHQLHATRLVCADCRLPFDVTHAETLPRPWCCSRCASLRLLAKLVDEGQQLRRFTAEGDV